MAEHQHFSHPHLLKFHKFGLEGATITCTGCKFPCSDDLPIYSCRGCKFYLHGQCFDATRSLTHLLHPAHPLSLFPSPTYKSGSFCCSSCNEIGSGFCFCCTTCEFDLHIHCAYKDSNSNNNSNSNNYKQKSGTSSAPNKVKIKAHPNHPLFYRSKPPSDSCWCDVCGTNCDPNTPEYRCETCNYDVHLECVSLPEMDKREDHPHNLKLLDLNPYESFECDVCGGTISQKQCMYLCKSGCDYGTHVKCVRLPDTDKRADHPHELKLLRVNPYEAFECDVCRGTILQKHCMYLCKSGCNYGMHAYCVSAEVTEIAQPMNDMQFQVEMFKLQNKMKLHEMLIDTKLMGISGYNHRYHRY